MTAPRHIIVAGVGNMFFSDDGFGSEVVRELLASHAAEIPVGAEVVDIGIRGRDLGYQLVDGGHEVLVLVDTVHRDSPAGTIHVLEHDMDGPKPPAALDGHGWDPATMLATLDALAAGAPVALRRVLVVGCEPESMHEGMGLSEPVAAAVAPAAKTVIELVHELSEKEGTKS